MMDNEMRLPEPLLDDQIEDALGDRFWLGWYASSGLIVTVLMILAAALMAAAL